MKKRILVLIVITIVVMSVSVVAEGFFPSTATLFGQTMPSLSSVINREADSVVETEEGTVYTFNDFTGSDYEAFSSYLAGTGCGVEQISIKEKVLHDVLVRDGAQAIFIYDYAASIASMSYPEGVRMEDAQHKVDVGAAEILPSLLEAFGTAMPSMNTILNLHRDMTVLPDGGAEIVYSDVTEEDYDAFSGYLAAYGCALTAFDTMDGVAFADLMSEGVQFRFEYDSKMHTARLSYPDACYIQDLDAVEMMSTLLPSAETAFGVFMPRIALATTLESTGITETNAGYEETYEGFTDQNYKEFSVYLSENDCEVKDYSLDDNGVLTIELEKNGSPFVFIYDRNAHRAVVRYDANTRPEPTATPAPTLTPRPTVKPTPKPTAIKLYSPEECWLTARSYFENLRWNDPSSLTIYNHNWSMNADGVFTFTIDYAARTVAGGMKRDTAFISVDGKTNQVTWCYTG